MTSSNEWACRCSRRRGARRGASKVEYLVVLALTGLAVISCVRVLGRHLSQKAMEQGDRVMTLEAAAPGDVDLPEHGGPPVELLPSLLAVTTTAADPGHLIHGAGHFVHAYEAWHGLYKGFKDTGLEQRWGANGVRDKETAPQEARKALDAAVASLDPARDADLVTKGKEIRTRVDKIHGEALHGSPSDGGKTGFNKLSIWGGLGDLVGVETRLYPSVTEWRKAARQVEKDVTDYLDEVKARNAKRRADDQVADFKKKITDERDAMVDKAKRLNTMKADEAQAELEKALTQAFLRDAFKNTIPGRPNPLGDWKTINEAAQRDAAARAKEIMAKHPHLVRPYLEGYYAENIKMYNLMLSYDPNAKPGPVMRARP